jgi:hypothetical protein
VTALFAATVFLSAVLTFLVQPMMGKTLLPLVGGTPGVWNACLLFFQSALLLGYVLAHQLRHRPATHALAALVLGVVTLAVGMASRFDPTAYSVSSNNPVPDVLWVLLVSVGGPFLVLSMTAPLAQAWYARANRNPYPLYAASNLGSFAGLLSYPLLVEPLAPLAAQRMGWAVAFGVWVLAVCGCMRFARKYPVPPREEAAALPRRRTLKWIGLAALTSSFLMSATTHLTTDIAPVPLLWVIPLGLYLLSFVVVFSRWPASARRLMARLTPMMLCFLTIAVLTRAGEPMTVVATVHLVAFFAVALLVHGELAADRPAANQLTTFYLWLSIGGVLGGLFNTFVAPVLFSSLGNVEYPLAIVLAALVRPSALEWRRSDFVWPLVVGAVAAAFVFGVPVVMPKQTSDNPADQLLDRVVRGGLSFGVPAAVAFALVWRPVRFALCLGAMLLVGSFAPNPHGKTLETSRNFFGTLRVTRSDDGQFTRIVHGTTLHGQQKVGEGRPIPATYYHPSGPLGQAFAGLTRERRKRVGVVGLGAGAAAAYANPGETWTFFEIDPGVVRIAQDTRYFTFLSTCPAAFDIRLGDARRELARDESKYDVLVLDAFNSDSVPVHMLTVEAMRLYLSRLTENGVLVMHVSNRYLDLAPLVGRVVAAVDPTLVVRWDDDRSVSDVQKADGKTASTWVVVARRVEDTPTQANGRPNSRWQKLPPGTGPVWRDDFSNLLGVWRRDGEGD